MRRGVRLAISISIFAIIATALAVTGWVAHPPKERLELPAPLQPFDTLSSAAAPYALDYPALTDGFQAQLYRSYCGPASLATVLRAYGVLGADQRSLFTSTGDRLRAFYSGMTLEQLDTLTQSTGLRTERVHADSLTLESFRDRLKRDLAQPGDFVVVNYDRRVLKQAGAGHISPVAAYDSATDAFLVLDEAAYRYPFTWVPAELLFAAVHTRDGDAYRGVLFIRR